jgi:ribose transport system substrate-binding protein
MKYSLPKAQIALAAATVVLALASSAAFADTPSWCGPKKASLALLDGYGGNSWRLVTTASGKQEAEKCPSIVKYEYADGQGNTQKAISDINSFAARGVDALVVFGDAGPAVLPALTNAYKAGRVVVPYRVVVGGEEGKNYTKFVGASFVDDGVSWGNFIKSILPNGGNLLFLSGPAGNSQGLDELKGLKQVLGDEYKFLNTPPFDVTNWDPALTQKVLTAEISKDQKIDVIVSDFGPSLGCLWADVSKDNPDFKLFTVATGNDNVRLAVDWAVAKATGGQEPTETIFKAPNFENSVTGKPSAVQCRKDLPGSIYLSAEMSGDDQAKAVNK